MPYKTTTYLFPVSTAQNRPMSQFASPRPTIFAASARSGTAAAISLKAKQTAALRAISTRLRPLLGTIKAALANRLHVAQTALAASIFRVTTHAAQIQPSAEIYWRIRCLSHNIPFGPALSHFKLLESQYTLRRAPPFDPVKKEKGLGRGGPHGRFKGKGPPLPKPSLPNANPSAPRLAGVEGAAPHKRESIG